MRAGAGFAMRAAAAVGLMGSEGPVGFVGFEEPAAFVALGGLAGPRGPGAALALWTVAERASIGAARLWRQARGWAFPPWGGRDLDIVLLARLSMSAARALAAIVVPLYLATRGYSGLRLGEVFLAAAVVSVLISTSVGLAADRVGRKPFLVVTPFLVTLAGGVFALVTSSPVLFAAAAIGGVGRGAGAGAGAVGPYQPAESAFVTDKVPARWRNDAFGRLSFFSSLGALVGGLLAVLLSPGTRLVHGALSSYRPAFVAIGVLGGLAGLGAIWLAEPDRAMRGSVTGAGDEIGRGIGADADIELVGDAEVGDADEEPAASVRRLTTGGETGQQRKRIFPRRSLPVLIRLWLTNTVNGFAIGMFGPFVTYWLYRRYGVGAGTIGVLYSITNVVTLGSAVVAAPLARRFKTVRTVTAVRLVQAVLLVPIALSPFFWLAGLLYVVRMFAQRIGMPLRQSYVLALADPEERSSVAALANLPSQAAMAGSPVLAGYLFDDVGLALPFELGGILQLVNAIMYYGFFRNIRPEEELAREGVGARGEPVRRAGRPGHRHGAGGLPRAGSA